MKKNEALNTAQMYFMWGNTEGKKEQVLPKNIVNLTLQYLHYKEWKKTALELRDFLKRNELNFITTSSDWIQNQSLAQGRVWVDGDEVEGLEEFPTVNFADFYRESIQPLIHFLATTKLVSEWDRTVLMLAVYGDYRQFSKSLLAIHGIDVNVKTYAGMTALMFAVFNFNTEIVKALLLVDGIDVNAADKYGETALIMAARAGYTGIVPALLTVDGIDVNAVDIHGRTAYSLGNDKIKKLITDHLDRNNDKASNKPTI